jgi:hypothetical protein
MNEQMNIYRSFEQWKNGGFLEHGAPRTEEYTAEELHLVEMGWNYGYDAGRAVEQALDKMAENARELGLSYDDAPKPWVNLTDEEMEDLWAIHSGLPLYRAIEAKLKEKNT